MFRSPSSLIARNRLRLPRQAEAISNHHIVVNNGSTSQCTLSSLSGKRLLSSTTSSDSKGELATSSSSSSSSSSGLVKQIVELQDRDFLHHGLRPRFRDYVKFQSPRKRASKLLLDLNNEMMSKSKSSNPAVWETPFRVGDAIELEVISQGGIPQKEAGSSSDGKDAAADATAAAASDDTAEKEDNKDNKKKEAAPSQSPNKRNLDRIRGVVLGIFNNKMDTAVLLRDVVFGVPIERRIPLHSPLIQSLRVLEKNFVFKGKKKIKRAKLYYLSDRNPLLTQVTGTKKLKREK